MIIGIVIVSNINLLKVYTSFSMARKYLRKLLQVFYCLIYRRFLHFEEQFESFPAYVANYSWEKSISL